MEPRKPFLDNVSIEDLIELASKEATVDESSKITDVGFFIMDTTITPVDKMPRTEGPHIYWAYCKWCKRNSKVPMTRVKFFAEFKKRFKICHSSKGGVTYWIDPKPFELSTDEWWEMRRALRREPNYNKKKKKDTKK